MFNSEEEENAVQRLYGLFMDLDHVMVGGEPYVSIHAVDAVNEVIKMSVEHALERGEEINEDHLFGIAWTANIYQIMHDALEMKAEASSLPDTPEELFKELDEDS